MKRYKLLKDLPTFKAGDEFFISEKGNLIARTPEKTKKVIVGTGDSIVPIEVDLMAYAKETLEQFPNILTEWFEEIDPFEVPDEFEMGFWTIVYHIEDGFYTWHMPSDEFEDSYEDNLKHHMEIGLAFETEKEAEKHLKWLKARAILLKDTKGFEPDWNDKDEWKYYVYYNHNDSTFGLGSMSYINDNKIYFETKEDAKNSVKLHEKEWKIYLGVEE